MKISKLSKEEVRFALECIKDSSLETPEELRCSGAVSPCACDTCF